MAQETQGIVWGVDYRKLRDASHIHGERWVLVVTRLSDGKLITTWHCNHRPVLEDIRQAMGRALARYAKPEAVWCDDWLAAWLVPYCDKYGISRVHIRRFGRGSDYDARLDRVMRGSGAAPDVDAAALARHLEREQGMRAQISRAFRHLWN